jgi:hypothetical protein
MEPVHIRRITSIPLREVWKHEQYGLSRWLADNIDFLNDYLPFELDVESVSPEAAAGEFWVDIVADGASDDDEPFKVIIENQLEQTDHDHLGKVLTYVAAFGARAAIWIASRARPEHVKAVQWLNDESPLDAWLFELEAISIEDSPVAPILRQIAGPSAVTRRVKTEKAATRAQRNANLEFWTIVLPQVAEACSEWGLWRGREPKGNVHSWQAVPDSPVGNIGLQLWVTSEGSWTSLKVWGKDPAEARYLFSQLEDRRGEIEDAFGGALDWRSSETQRSAAIRWDNPVTGGRNSDPDQIRAAGATLADATARLAAATIPHVRSLAPYSSESEPGPTAVGLADGKPTGSETDVTIHAYKDGEAAPDNVHHASQ